MATACAGLLMVRYCLRFPCRSFAEPGSAYCAQHRPARAPKEADPFYLTVRWRRFRNWYLAQHPLCEMCEREGRQTIATMVDHVTEIKDGGALTDEENAQSLCSKCHAMKTSMTKNHRKLTENNRRGSRTHTNLSASGRRTDLVPDGTR